MSALKHIFISFIPPLLIAVLSATLAYSHAIGVTPIAPDLAVFCAAIALAIAIIFGAVLQKSSIACAAFFAIALFWLIVGGRIENAALECVKALGWYLLPIVNLGMAFFSERPIWSAEGILRLLCAAIALFLIVLLSVSPYAIGAAATLEYGFGDAVLGVPKGAAAIYALAWILFLAKAFSQGRKLIPIALGAACGAFFAGLVFISDRALCAIFFGAGAAILIAGSLPFTFVKRAAKEKTPPLKKPEKEKTPKKRSMPLTAPRERVTFSKETLLKSAKSLFDRAKTPLILAHPDLRFFSAQSKISVVLSPAYYWYKRSDAPFKSRRAAKRFAASIFFGWIPEGDYRYFAFREENGWGFIACDPSDIARRLNEQGLDLLQISRVYFAQSALDPIDSPIGLSNNFALSFIEGAWVTLPIKFAANAKRFDETPRVLNAPSFALSRSEEAGDIPQKRFWTAASFLLLLIGSIAIDTFRMTRAANALNNERAAILERSKLPATQMQLESIERRLNQIAAAQRGLRETLAKLFSLSQSARLEKLDFEGRTIAARFAPLEENGAQAIIDRLKSALPDAEARIQDNIVWAAIKW
ncbi:MAG: hypothetical protein LBP89_05685 [Helicobacteraceae bacterium]|nr:hypothetical protein [Helicobacteraceae bacterium]